MGEKANRYAAVAGALVVVAAGIGQVAGGFNMLFGEASLPECQSADASSLVRQIIVDNFEVELDHLDEVTEVNFDEEGQKRGCTAVIDAADEGVYEIAYDLTWHDRDDKMLSAEVQVLGQRE
ncbi:MAG TPA: hypothetical protein VGN80_01215 [Devosiaceae bacterium]|nr:hypothetical protein [Devosiaceae bacterium]